MGTSPVRAFSGYWKLGLPARHILLPLLMPAAFFAVAFTPVHVLGCRTRGLLALLIAVVSGLAAIAALVRFRKGNERGATANLWWFVSAVIMTTPVIALIIMA
jgi:hypothetical protein